MAVNYNTIEEIINKGMLLKNKSIDFLGEIDENKNKGVVGQLVEKYFGLSNNNLSQPDFTSLGIDAELKTTPIKITRNGHTAKERLVLGMIDFANDHLETEFIKSRIFNKIKNIVIVNYLVNNNKEVFMDTWELKYSEEELKIIENDFEIIVGKIRQGRAHELSDSDTTFLSATRKGHKEGPINQPFSETKAPKRAWCFKTGFMTRKTREHYNGIKEAIGVYGKSALALAIENELSKFKGMTADEILILNNQKPQSNKSKNVNAINWALKSAKIPVHLLSCYDLLFKTMKTRKNGKFQESMSFSQLNFTDLEYQDFEDSEIFQYLSNGVIVNIFSWDNRYLKTAYIKFSPAEIENAREVFNRIKKSLKSKLLYQPKLSEHLTIHMRPKGLKSNDSVKISTGEIITKQTLWINSEVLNKKI